MSPEKRVILVTLQQLMLDFKENPCRFSGSIDYDGDMRVFWNNAKLENGNLDPNVVKTEMTVERMGGRFELKVNRQRNDKSFTYRTDALWFDLNYWRLNKLCKTLQARKNAEKKVKDTEFLNDLFPHMNDHKLLGK